MPDRVVRQDILTSDPVNSLSWAAEVFYRRLMSIADDFGRYEARPSLLRASLYPLKLDRVSEPDVVKWMGECSEAGLVRTYTVDGKEYMEILKFGQRLRAMKSRYPAPFADTRQHPPTSADICQHLPADDNIRQHPLSNDGLKRNESETETETEKNISPKGDSEAGASPTDNISVYNKLEKNKKNIVEFIRFQKPLFIEPYVDLWNVFAKEKGLSQVTKISDLRKRKFRVRIKETGFDFIEILKKAGQSAFLLSGKWFGFDWIFENEGNYLKVVEGNYDRQVNDLQKTVVAKERSSGKNFNDTMHYLYGRYREGDLDERLIEPDYYDQLIVRNTIPLGFMENQPGTTPDEKKRHAVLAFFKFKSEANGENENL